jgi:predicted DNA-binding transcriptional regulator YafY
MNYLLLSIIFGLAWYLYSIKKKQSISSQLDRHVEITVAVASDSSVSEDKDAWDPVPKELYSVPGLRKALIGISLHIRFKDLEGQITQRDISTVWYAYNRTTGDGLVYAYCQMRQANRPFVFKRIKHAVSVETGEIIPNLGEYLDSAGCTLPPARYWQTTSATN